MPDYQLSLAIGKDGQNARLSARLTGWRIDIKSETQLEEEEAYEKVDWAEGEWVVDPDTGEQVWQPAEGGPAISAEDWAAGSEDEEDEVEESAEVEEAETEVEESAGVQEAETEVEESAEVEEVKE